MQSYHGEPQATLRRHVILRYGAKQDGTRHDVLFCPTGHGGHRLQITRSDSTVEHATQAGHEQCCGSG